MLIHVNSFFFFFCVAFDCCCYGAARPPCHSICGSSALLVTRIANGRSFQKDEPECLEGAVQDTCYDTVYTRNFE
jgi:hypothetical protein